MLDAPDRALAELSREELVARWVAVYRVPPPRGVRRGLLERAISWHQQAKTQGGLSRSAMRQLRSGAGGTGREAPAAPVGAGTRLVREWGGRTHVVEVTEDGCRWNGSTYRSLSAVAQVITGARWSGPRFFGIGASGDGEAR